ncbi:MAG TPA: glycosyl transferase, partial [Myxococcota bacterium]|nr:glycosyl transferase [Myxococcota bacterium]
MRAPGGDVAAPFSVEEPIRAELFGIERLEQHAESLAEAERATERPTRGRDLLPRVRENARELVAAYHDIVEAVGAKSEITLAEEWFLDNFHVVDEQLREIRDHLPKGYYRQLPKIAAGHLAGTPRVYGLAWAYVAHTDSRFELETLRRFVKAYQRVQPLGIGELWAVPIHLRIALVENLRRLSVQGLYARHARAKADALADRLLGLRGQLAEDSERVLRGLGDVKLARAFAVQLAQRLHDQDASTLPALEWLNERLAAQDTTSEDAVAREHQAQGAANATVRNLISSMRWMSSIDWLEFFESVSPVDEVLRGAPAFSAMDFATRDAYRKQIEILSRGSGCPELEVATAAVELAHEAAKEGPEADPGYSLVAKGRRDFERKLGFRFQPRLAFQRACRRHAIAGYLGAVAVLTALPLGAVLFAASTAGVAAGPLILLAILGVVPASEIAVSLVHRLVPMILPPRRLAKLELAEGVPAELRTLVAVPTLLTTLADLEEQLERLEVHYLANPEGHLHFALLTDGEDAAQEHLPGDAALVAALGDGIERLNARYDAPPGEEKRFLVLHRRRLWNEREGKWIGWERKRGKLHELNRLLRGATDTTFMSAHGQAPAPPEGVRYVITLDADTRLPKGAAYRLVGAMAHPLNRPRFDPATGRVVDGYGVLQPRITPSLPTGPASTPFQRIVSGPGGVDPYAAAISDVYQDLFEEGSYTGKGIYEVDVFEAALAGRVPENTMLSHDLFEGLFARAGLLTDVELFEEFPANYEVAARRHHRWVRGDWQLLPWILGRTRLPAQCRWKMVDNLRRSLLAPASFLLAVAAFVLPGAAALPLLALVIGAIAVPAFIPVLDGLIPRRLGISKRSHLRAVGNDLLVACSQTLLALTVLAHQAWLMTDAVARTLARVYVTKRGLLEWLPAAQAGYGGDLRLRLFYRHLLPAVLLSGAAALLVAVLRPAAWPIAAPLVALWALSPAIAWRVSLPPRLVQAEILTPEETRSLRLVARRTWRFFETFVDRGGHALPPDNFQEDPQPVVAHRTSPTNLGLYLLSVTVAHDFGWIGTQDAAKRLEDTLETMSGMRRFRGHFFNWYDTQDLRPLDPAYVSTVDSGNLAGHLYA